MDLSVIRTGLKTRLSGVTGLTAYAVAPGSVTPVAGGAVAVIVPDPGVFLVRDSQGPGTWAVSFVVKLLVAASMTEAAQNTLDGFLDPTGASSVVAALEDESVGLGGGGDYATVVACRGYGAVEYSGANYFGAEVVVGVGAR